jgi:hypothetical protein
VQQQQVEAMTAAFDERAEVLLSSGQKLLRQGLPPGQLPQRLGITAARWQEIQEACSITVVALPPET